MLKTQVIGQAAAKSSFCQGWEVQFFIVFLKFYSIFHNPFSLLSKATKQPILGPAGAKWQGWEVQKLILNPNTETKQCVQRAKETKKPGQNLC